MKIETKEIALVALLAAVYALGNFLPGFPMIGAQGTIPIVRSLEMGYGFILGPILGPLTAFLGAIVGKTLTGGGFGMFFTPLALVSTFMAAALSRRYVFKVKGWIIAAALSIVLIAGWYGMRAGLEPPYYPILHFIGFSIILVFRGRLADYLQSEDKGKLSLGVALSSFPATIAGHMLGNLIWIVLMNPAPLYFIGTLPAPVFERITITFLSTMIATPLILTVRTLFPELVEKS